MNSSATTLPLDIFTQMNFVAVFIPFKLNFIHKMTNLLSEPPYRGLKGNVRSSSIARWKARCRLHILNFFR